MIEPDKLSAAIASAQSGDPAGFDALIDAYSHRLYGYFFRLTGSVDDAQDLLQELFLRLISALGSYKHHGQFDAFIFRIATNLYRDRLRKERRDLIVESRDEAAAADSQGATPLTADPRSQAPDSRLEEVEVQHQLQVALALLPPAEREVLILRHFSELSFRDIAETMGTPLGTALARAHRGLSKLRHLIEGPKEA